MMDAMKEALERKKKGAMKIEIIINGKPSQEEEQSSGLAPEVKDADGDEEMDPKGLMARDAYEDEDDLDEEDEAARLKKMVGEDPQPSGRNPMGLDERAKAKMRSRLTEIKK